MSEMRRILDAWMEKVLDASSEAESLNIKA